MIRSGTGGAGRKSLLRQTWGLVSTAEDAMFHFFEIGKQTIAFTRKVPDSEQRTDSGTEFKPIDRFGKEVVAASFDSFFDVPWFIEGGDDEHGDHAFGWIILDLCADFIAAHTGHHDIQQNEIGLVLFDHLHRLLAVRGHENLIALISEVGFQQFTVLLDVIGDQDTGGGDVDVWVRHGWLSVAGRQRRPQ